jgi:hypothetical protein
MASDEGAEYVRRLSKRLDLRRQRERDRQQGAPRFDVVLRAAEDRAAYVALRERAEREGRRVTGAAVIRMALREAAARPADGQVEAGG